MKHGYVFRFFNRLQVSQLSRSVAACGLGQPRTVGSHFGERSSEILRPSAPIFVVEIRSTSDDLKVLKDKMEEYRDNGCRLGWLIDRAGKQVFVYRGKRLHRHSAGRYRHRFGGGRIAGTDRAD